MWDSTVYCISALREREGGEKGVKGRIGIYTIETHSAIMERWCPQSFPVHIVLQRERSFREDNSIEALTDLILLARESENVAF